MFKVKYTIKEESKLLVDKSKYFKDMKKAVRFLKELDKETLVGKPTLERDIA